MNRTAVIYHGYDDSVRYWLIACCACGRIAFDPLPIPPGGDAAPPACMPLTMDIPGATAEFTYRVARVPNGWAVAWDEPGGVQLVTIDDAGTIGAPVMLPPHAGTVNLVTDLVWTGSELALQWREASPTQYVFAYSGIDGTGVREFATVSPMLGAGWNGQGYGRVFDGAVTGSVVFDTIDVNGGTTAPVQSMVAAVAIAAGGPLVFNGTTYAFQWLTSGNPVQDHLSAFDASGQLLLANRSLGATTGTRDAPWLGNLHVILWDTGSGAQFETVDANMTVIHPAATFLGLTTSSGLSVAWDGSELGVIRMDYVAGDHDVAFATAGPGGMRVTADQKFGAGVLPLDGPFLAAGPARFAFVWGTGNPLTALHFAVVCR